MSRGSPLFPAALLAVAAALAAPVAAWDKAPNDYETESRQYGAFELRFGPYRPAVDDNPSLNGTPYADVFNDDAMFLTAIEFDWQFIHPPGFSLAIGGSLGFMQAYAKSLVLNADGTTERSSADYTVLNVMPFVGLFVIRVDALADMVNVPLVPYFKIGLDWYLWWTREGGQKGRIEYTDDNGETQRQKARGGTLGWQLAPGLAVRLDPFDRAAARTFDNDVGVNHSYLFVEVLWAFVDRFGSPGYMNLSTDTFARATIMAGLALEF